jgi:uncharacterized protein YjiS (DUF1127 family)
MLNKLKAAILRFHQGIVKSQQRRADFFILTHMTDAELRDIGVARGEIKERYYAKD